MLYRFILCCGTFCLLFAGCSKEKSNEETYDRCNYAPYVPGNSFTYQRILASHDTLVYTVKVTGDTLLQGQIYAVLNNEYNNQYIRCNDGLYYLFEPGVSRPDYESPDGERLFLYDYMKPGQSWINNISATVSGVEQQGVLQYTVIQTGVPKTVLGNTYTDVIGIRQDADLILDGVFFPIGTIATYYYAKGVGYIEVDSPTDTIRMLRYSVH